MQTKKISKILILVSISIAFLSANNVKADLPEVQQALDRFEKGVVTHTLSNGLKVIIYKQGVAPVFSAVLGVKVGGVDEKEGETGISHMFEHMAFKGTPDIGTKDYKKEKVLLDEQEDLVEMLQKDPNNPTAVLRLQQIDAELNNLWIGEQFSRELETRGAQGLNASTDKELTKYMVSLPRSAFEYWCWIESERLLHPVIRQFYKEREVVLEEKRMRFENDPTGLIYEKLLSTAYQVHSYKNPVIGFVNDLKNLTARKLEEFRKKYYVPSNMALAIVGDVSEKDLYTIEKYFGRIPKSEAPKRDIPVEPEQTQERNGKVIFTTSPQLMIGYHKPAYPDPFDPAITVLEEVLAEGRTSLMYKELVLKKHLASSVNVEEAPGFQYPNLIVFAITPRAPHTNDEVIAEFDRILKRKMEDYLTEEKIETVKRKIAVRALGEISTDGALSDILVTSYLIYGDWKVNINWYSELMDVTREDVLIVAKKYMVPTNRTVIKLEKSKNLGK